MSPVSAAAAERPQAVPAPLAECIAALDREIAERRADMEHCEERVAINAAAIERCEAIKHAYRHAAQILAADVAPAPPSAAPSRQRRDLRTEVRQCLADTMEGLLPAEIGTRLQIRPAQVDSALKWLRARGELAPVAYDGKVKLAKNTPPEAGATNTLFTGDANV